MSSETPIPTVYDRLRDPFAPMDIEWRVQSSGDKNGKPWARVLAYVTARAIMDRLDAVVGPENWRDEYAAGPDGGVMCRLYIRSAAGEWICKEDASENTDIEAVKGGISGALKRAAVKWGIGRYLYDLGESWAEFSPDGAHLLKAKDGSYHRWNPPALPKWALPAIPAPVPPPPVQAAPPKPAPLGPLATQPQLAKLNVVGGICYGDKWEVQKRVLYRAASKGRTESGKELTKAEVEKLIDGIEKKIAADETGAQGEGES